MAQTTKEKRLIQWVDIYHTTEVPKPLFSHFLTVAKITDIADCIDEILKSEEISFQNIPSESLWILNYDMKEYLQVFHIPKSQEYVVELRGKVFNLEFLKKLIQKKEIPRQ